MQRLTVTAESDPEKLRAEWLSLQREGATSVFQTYEWCHAWLQTVGAELGAEACLVTGHDGKGRLTFLLPLAIYPGRSARVIRWLGYPVSTYGFGVYNRDFLHNTGDCLTDYWESICRALPPADAICLESMPAMCSGHTHPLAPLFQTEDANSSYTLELQANYDQLYESQRPAKSRARARKRDQKLNERGELIFKLPKPGGETAQALDDMFNQQTRRLAEVGIHGVFDDASQRFVHALASLPEASGVPRLMPFQLSLDGRTIAIKLGIEFAGTFWAMISSVDPQGIERLSPGEHALRRTIEECCKMGVSWIDMAAGDTGYKQQWASQEVSLHTTSRALSPRGVLWKNANAAAAAGKKAIKNSETLWPLAQRLRASLLGHKRA